MVLKRALKISRNILLILLGLIILLIALVNTTPVQNYLAGRATQWLSSKLRTKVSVQHVRVDFLNHFSLQGLYIEDQAHDTLLYAGEAQVRITDWFVWKDKPVLHYLAMNNTYIHLYRTSASSDWNYDFVAKAFATNATPKSRDTGKVAEFDLEKIALNNVRFHFDDSWVG